MGGEQPQVMVADEATLGRAAAEPVQCRDLVVRVSVFAAYPVTVTSALQREIIAGSEASL